MGLFSIELMILITAVQFSIPTPITNFEESIQQINAYPTTLSADSNLPTVQIDQDPNNVLFEQSAEIIMEVIPQTPESILPPLISLPLDEPTTEPLTDPSMPLHEQPSPSIPTPSGVWTGFDFIKSLHIGQTGEDVYQLKYALHFLGYPITTKDFMYDKSTSDIVMKFQKDHKLHADGIIGPESAKMLNKILKEKEISIPKKELSIAQSASAGYWITINKTTNTLSLFRNKSLIKKFPVATGAKPTLTPEGKFYIKVKLVNPAWGGGGYAKPVKGGSPTNPLGYRWMGLDYKGGGQYGIHGTTAPKSIGTYASHGCIRMNNTHSEELYDLIPQNTPVWIGTMQKLKLWGVDEITTPSIP